MAGRGGSGAGKGRAPYQPGNADAAKPGNLLALKHGAYSPRRVDPLASELVERTLADQSVGFLAAPAYRPALWAWARAEARVQLLEEYLGPQVGDLGDERVTAAYRELHRCETRAATLRSQLGLTPLARARLGKDVAQARHADAAAVMAELHRLEQQGHIPTTPAPGATLTPDHPVPATDAQAHHSGPSGGRS